MYGVVRTDKMFGTDNRAGLVSVRCHTAIENGSVVKLGTLEDGSREVFVCDTPAADSELHDVVLVATPELMYDERKRNFDEFINEKGTIARGYRLHTGDIFSVTKTVLGGVASPAVGNVVELADDTKLSVATATTGATKVGEIIAIENAGLHTYFVIKVD